MIFFFPRFGLSIELPGTELEANILVQRSSRVFRMPQGNKLGTIAMIKRTRIMPGTTSILPSWIQLDPCIQLPLMPSWNGQKFLRFAEGCFPRSQLGKLRRCNCPLCTELRKMRLNMKLETLRYSSNNKCIRRWTRWENAMPSIDKSKSLERNFIIKKMG